MERKLAYLGEPEEEAIRAIIEKGYAESTAGAIRIAVRQFAAAIVALPPIVTLTTPYA